MNTAEARRLIAKFEQAVRESMHKLANKSNDHFVNRLREELVEQLTK